MTKQDILDSIAADYRAGRITDECIPAPGGRNWDGYGYLRLRFGKRVESYNAHNYTLKQAVGDPPPDKPQAAHSCTSKDCVNPAHLSWKSHGDNQRDRKRDGTVSAGERQNKAKLTDPEVLEIRRLYSTGEYTKKALSEMYDVSPSTISRIVARKIWTHI